jgi:thiosulfate/3-mercaptopyruvate sulfurtransferase
MPEMSYTTLVDVATLKENLANPDWRIVDVRHLLADVMHGERAYAESHLPGAVFLHCDRDLSTAMTGKNGRHPLPSVETFTQLMGKIGIGSTTQVVVYDDTRGMIAGRLWWMLRWLGHESVALLDGGWQAWLAAGGEVTQTAPDHPARSFVANVKSGPVEIGFVQDNMGSDRMCLIDARSADRYRGENEVIDPVGGRIPGAVNRFFGDNIRPDGLFKSAEQLRDEWQSVLGESAAEKVVHYCGSGVSSCLNLLSMEIAGLAGSRLYAGSWSEWCADPTRPFAQGLSVEKK